MSFIQHLQGSDEHLLPHLSLSPIFLLSVMADHPYLTHTETSSNSYQTLPNVV
nr:MAG TPA: hypothetical protein [Caudoviricetes sp.]